MSKLVYIRDCPTQICCAVPMVVVEESGVMKAVVEERTRVDQLDEGDWLQLLLADVHQEVARQPSPRAVERIRGRLLIEMKTPAQAAA